MFCPNCGKELSDNAKICPNCGEPIKKSGKIKSDVALMISSLVLIALAFIMNFISIFIAWFDSALSGFWMTIPTLILIFAGLGCLIPALAIRSKNK